MGRLSRLFFSSGPSKFKFVGSPWQEKGPGGDISASYVLTSGFQDEPIKVHCFSGYMSALYLVEYIERGEFLLLDCGYPSDYRRIQFYFDEVLNAHRKDKLTMKKNLKLAVATHCHLDHSGSASAYHSLGIPLVRPTDMETCYVGWRRRLHMLAEATIGAFVGVRLHRAVEDPFVHSKGLFGPYWDCILPVVATLKDGQPLPCGFDDWVAIKIPGHTMHMIALYHVPSRMLYTADLMVKLRKGFFAPEPVNYEWAFNHTIHRMRGLDVACCLMPHGGIIDVEDQYESWSTILDDVVLHARDALEHPRSNYRSLRSFITNQMSTVVQSTPCEQCNFSPLDLESSQLPKAWPWPQNFTVLR